MECHIFSDGQVQTVCTLVGLLAFMLLVWGLRKCLFIWPESK